MRRVLTLAVSLAVAAPATAAPFSAVTARPLPPGTSVVHVQVGYPAVAAAFLTGLDPTWDLGGGLEGDYLLGRLTADGRGRYRLLDRGTMTLSVTGSVGLAWNTGATYDDPDNVSNLGLVIAPGVVGSWHPHPQVALYAESELPFQWTWRHGGGWQLPLLLGAGVEYAMARDLNLVFYGRLGPRFEGGGGHTGDTDLVGEVGMGFTFRLF